MNETVLVGADAQVINDDSRPGLPRIDSACKNCIFALYDGKTQVGCQMDMLTKFRNVGAVVLDCYDDEKEFFVVQGRLCRYCKTKDWLALKGIDSLDEAAHVIEEESRVNFDLLIYFGADNQLSDLDETLESIDYVGRKFNSLTIVLNAPKIKPLFFRKQLAKYPKLPKWSVEVIMDGPARDEAIRVAMKNCHTMYGVVVDAADRIPNQLLANIDKAVNEKLERIFTVAFGDNGMVWLTKLTRILGPHSLPAMVEILEKTEHTPFMRTGNDFGVYQRNMCELQ